MGGQKEDFYRNFSRKDLQDLCKKYGLPANKSNSDMASSLILYLEKKNLNSRIWKANGGDPLSVETLEPRRRRISPSGDRQKDSRGTMSSSGSGNNQCNIQNGQLDLQNSKDPTTSDKVSEDVGILSQFHRDSNSSADLLENTFPCDVRSSVQAPHFQFDVSSEDGIQLFVDLNSSPSDWIESLKDGVHICSDMHKLESPNYLNETSWQCCCKHMEVSSLVDSYEEVDNRDVAEGSHPVTTGLGALLESNELNGAEGSLSSPGRDPGNTTHHLENFGEDQATTSSRPESDIEKHVCGAKFCIRAGIVPADPNADVVPQVKTFNNSSGYSLSSFAKRSKMLESKIMNVDGDFYNRPSLQQMHGPPDPVVVCTELSSSPSQEIRESSGNTFDQDRVTVCQDITCQPQNNGTEQCGLTNLVTFTEMQTFEVAAGHTKSASSSGLLDGHSSDPTDVNQDVEIENNKASTSGEYDRQILDSQKYQASNQINGYESGDVNLMSSIETVNRFMLHPHEVAQQAVEIHSSLDDVPRNEALLSSCSNCASPSFVAPEQNGAGHCTPPDSDDLDKDVQKSRPTSMEILGRVVAGDQRKKSECLDFRDSTTHTWRKASGSESSRDRKRKLLVNGTGGQNQSDAKITRITRQFAGKIHDSRRRSSRLFTK